MSESGHEESLRARAHHFLTREEGGSGGLTMRAGTFEHRDDRDRTADGERHDALDRLA